MSASDREGEDDRKFLKKIDAMTRAQEPIPPELEEWALEIHLKNDPGRSDLLQRLCAVVAAQGRPIPLELEERALLAILVNDPAREDIQTRLKAVQVALGKAEPPAPAIGPSGEQASETGVDFQQESRSYEEKANYEDLDPEFRPIMELVRQYSMTSVERMNGLCEAIRYVNDAGIAGDIVECGVWRGGSMMAIAKMLSNLGDTSRDLHLFDTFEGMSDPTEHDVAISGETASYLLAAESIEDATSVWCVSGLDEVKSNMARTGYPASNIHYHVGMVEETVPGNAPEKIACLRLDTDWYESTRHELEHLFPRLSDGGVLIIDDYGHWAGARKAVDEYLEKHSIGMMLHRLDYTGRLGIYHAGVTRKAGAAKTMAA